MLLGVLFGIIIFFIGMVMISHSTKHLATHQFKNIIALLTTNPFLGIFVGMIATAVTQSSSATSILVVSLVNSGVMNLYQATSVIMGSNIGTTFTAQLVSFDFFKIIPHIFILGVLFFFLNFNTFTRNTGKFLIGFSFLFFGIKLMIYSLNPLKDLMGFNELMLSIQNKRPKGILIGAVTTAIIQSSSTSIAILQSLAFSGLINIYQALPIIMGQNIGTCVTTLFSSIAADKNGKRAAVIHLLFNIIGTLVLYPFIHIFASFIYNITPSDTVRQIANAHSLFNVMTVIILLPFFKGLVFISKKII